MKRHHSGLIISESELTSDAVNFRCTHQLPFQRGKGRVGNPTTNESKKSNHNQFTRSRISENGRAIATPAAAPRAPSIHRNPLGSHALTNCADRNPFLSEFAQQGGQSKAPSEPNEDLSTRIEDNPLRYVFRTPPSRRLNFGPGNTERSTCTPNSRASAETAPIQPSQRSEKNHRRPGKISEVNSLNSPEYTHDWHERMANT